MDSPHTPEGLQLLPPRESERGWVSSMETVPAGGDPRASAYLPRFTPRLPHFTPRLPRRSPQKRASDPWPEERVPSLWLAPSTPLVLLLYLQLALNLAIVSLLAYLVYVFVTTIRLDIAYTVLESEAAVVREMAVCAREYARNECDPAIRVPALEQRCLAWERCMHQDPKAVGRSRVGAQTLGGVVEGLVEPISWRTILVVCGGVVGALWANNAGWGVFRKQLQREHATASAKREQALLDVVPVLEADLLFDADSSPTPRHRG